MNRIKVIIGANYGDEGKGLATDYFGTMAAKGRNGANIINVLTNGGPQRGHTVERMDGRRHVFKHFGSAAFGKAVSYYAPQFLINPMEFIREEAELQKMDVTLQAYMNPFCRFTTPWDMLINQMLLKSRGTHNGCGFGIWETVLRYMRNQGISFSVFLQMSRTDRILYLRRLRDGYFVKRLGEIGLCEARDNHGASHDSTFGSESGSALITGSDSGSGFESGSVFITNSNPSSGHGNGFCHGRRLSFLGSANDFRDIFFSEDMLHHFEEDCESMRVLCPVRGNDFLTHFENVLFENAQGLLLDGNGILEREYTTPSTTGMGIVFNMIENIFRKSEVEVCYVTRPYLTRHGDGTLPNEIAKEKLSVRLPEVRPDDTNIENCFQGCLRYGILDTGRLAERIHQDFRQCDKATGNYYHPSVMITHWNEVTEMDTDLLREQFGTLYLSNGKCLDSVTHVT